MAKENKSIQEALSSLLDNKLDDMRSHINTALTVKAVEKLEEKKHVIAKSYFGQKETK